MVTKNFNIISKQDALEGKQYAKYIKKAKEDLFETLQIDPKLVNRNQMADALSKNRFKNGENKINTGTPAGEIKIRENIVIKINQIKYKNILNEYKKIIAEQPSDLNISLAKLDTLLVERMILDSGNTIEFKSTDTFDGEKPARQESKIAYEELSKIDQYTGKIDLISKKDEQGKDYFIIKRTDKQLKEIIKRTEEIKKNEGEQEEKNKKEETKKLTGTAKKIGNKNVIIKNNKGTININTSFDMQSINGLLEQIKNNIYNHQGNNQSNNQTNNQGNNQVNTGGTNTQLNELKQLLDEQYSKIIQEIEAKFTDKLGQFEATLKDSLEKQKKEAEETYQKQIEAIITSKEDITERIEEMEKKYKEQIEKLENSMTEEIDDTKTEIITEIKKTKEDIENINKSIEEMKLKISLLGEENKEMIDRLTDLLKAQIKALEERLIILQNKLDECCEEKKKKRIKETTPISGEETISDEEPMSSEGPISGEEPISSEGLISGEEPISSEEPVSGEEPIEGYKQTEELATISNTIEVNRVIAERKAGDRLRERRNKTGGRNTFDKLNLFLRRKSIKERYVEEELKYTDREKNKKLNRSDENKRGADRHEMEQAAGFNDKIENLVGTMMGIEKDYPDTYKRIITLANTFIGTPPNRIDGMTEGQFQTQFDYILRQSGTGFDTARPGTATMSNWKPLNQLLKSNDMEQLSTNIFMKMVSFKGHQKLVRNIADIIDKGEAQVPPVTDAVLDTQCRPFIADYIKKYNKMPDFLKQMGISIDDKDALKEIRNKQKNDRALLQIARQTIKLKIQILNKGEEAYSVEEKLNSAAKIGRRLDDPVKNVKWFKKHPGFKKMFGWMRGATKLGLMVAPGIAASAAGLPLLASAGMVGGVAFTKTLFAKYSHYNKEHRLYQREQAVNVLNNRQERERVANAVTGMKRHQGRFRGKNFKDRRQWNYYIKTTQDQLDMTPDLTQDIKGMLEKKEILTDIEKRNLRGYVSEGLARLDYHKEKGQNFLGSEKKIIAEKEYQELQRTVLGGTERLGTDLVAMRNEANYDAMINLLDKGTGDTYDTQGYSRARGRFKSRQHRQALIGATKAGAIAFGISYAAGLLTAKEATSNIEKTGTMHGRAEYNLGKYQESGYATGQNMNSLDTFLNSPTQVQNGGTLHLSLTGSTDATHVIPGKLTTADLNARYSSVNATIAGDPTLAPAYKTQLTTRLTAHNPSTMAAANAGHTNANLASMRMYTGIKEIADSLSTSTNSAVTSGGLHLDIVTAYATPGSTVLTQADRFVDLGVEATKKVVTEGSNGYAVGVGFDNTFASKENEQLPGQQGENNNPNNTRRRPDLGTFRYEQE